MKEKKKKTKDRIKKISKTVVRRKKKNENISLSSPVT